MDDHQFEVGQKVKLTDEALKTEYKNWENWEGEVVKVHNKIMEVMTTRLAYHHKYDFIGKVMSWMTSSLEPIDEIKFIIPENKTICPKCKSFDCKGLSRIECLLS